MTSGRQDADAHGRRGMQLLEQARAVQTGALGRRRRADVQAATLYGEALEHFRAAARLNPASAQAARLAGVVLRELGDLEGARASFAQACRLAPDDPRAIADHAAVLTALNRAAEAIELLEAALRLHPENAPLHGELALALLGSGEFARGWDEYEWRFRLPDAGMSRPVPYPRWQGESLAGKTLLVTSEQGIGDEIMFASCFNELLEAAGRCVFEVSTRLVRVFERSFPLATIVTRSLERSPAQVVRQPVDYWTPAGSVPRFLRRATEEFPAQGAYLCADPERTRHWRERLTAMGPRPWIGLAWTGGLPGTLRAARSLDLEALRPLLASGRGSFVALEFADCSDEARAFNAAGTERLAWWPEAVATLDETAAILGALDLLVSVPTATAHLAAALGRPTWVLVPVAPTWRYLWRGERMPWYPSMRVLRGEGPQPTSAVVERARVALEGFRP